MSLWITLCELWVSEHRGNTGLTVPFLVGASKYIGGASRGDAASQKDLAQLLFELQQKGPTKQNVRIEMCGSRRKPVVKIEDEMAVQNVAELVRARKGQSRLYLSQTYPHQCTLDSAIEALWGVVGDALELGRFSYVQGVYRELDDNEIAFIERAAKISA